MARIIAVARSDGRAGFSPFATHGAAHAGEKVAIGGGRYATVSSDGRINIPASTMREVGIKGADGRYRVAVEVGARTDDGKHRIGVFISTPPASMANTKTGDIVPRREAVEGEVIFPSDTEEYYPPD